MRWLASRRALRGNVHLDNFSRGEQVETWRTGRMVILAAKGAKDAKKTRDGWRESDEFGNEKRREKNEELGRRG